MAFLSMINRLVCIAAALLFFAGHTWADGSLNIVYLSRIDDPAYKLKKSYIGLKLKEKYSPIAGARAAMKESAVPGRAAGLAFKLDELPLPQNADLLTTVTDQLARNPESVFILDLPLADMEMLGHRLSANKQVVIFNVRQKADELRTGKCSAALFHVIPNTSMLTDAVAQYLGFMNWRSVLVLASNSENDKSVELAFMASARKFGLDIVDQRQFINSNDPREREKNEPRLLTGGGNYDVIFLADDEGEFGRYLAYNSYLPRPVVGTEELTAAAWHWTWERNGAPQLNQRIRKIAERNPSAQDWAAWAAVKSAVEAAIETGSTNPAQLADALRTDVVSIDMYKVGPGSYRPWDQQLRQPILLHTHNAVIGTAPFDGFLHRTNTFDTLGFDEAEKRCVLQR